MQLPVAYDCSMIFLKLMWYIEVQVLAFLATRRNKDQLGFWCQRLREPDLQLRPIRIPSAGSHNHLSLSDWRTGHTWDNQIPADRQQRSPHVKIWFVGSNYRPG